MSDTERQQQRVREFVSLLPLTLDLAGLPKTESGRYYNEDQIEARAITLRAAYKVARQLVTGVATEA